jgi:uncharacterized membrane protein YjgN (DUF898 family)
LASAPELAAWPPADSRAITALPTKFDGRGWTLFKLSFRTAIFTVLTLGFYRFWMKTRLRRWYWSAVQPGGTPLEYTGDPLEKLLGFLIAVVFLAFYIGIINLILMFLSFSLFAGNGMAYGLSFLGVLPIWFYAQYRARRYVLARTRWRGLRFGLKPGAWGYGWRALLHWGLTIVTLGLYWPRMRFVLEKYITDRTTFGDQTFTQGGRWQAIIRPFAWFWIPGVITGGVLAWALVVDMSDSQTPVAILSATLLGFAALLGYLYFIAASTRYMASHKTLGQGLTLTSALRPGRMMWIYIGGYLAVGLIVILITILALFLLGVMVALLGGEDQFLDLLVQFEAGASSAPTLAFSMSIYFGIFILWASLAHAWITVRLFRHYAQTLSLGGDLAVISRTVQVERDAMSQAEGFAEALDIGAAI